MKLSLPPGGMSPALPRRLGPPVGAGIDPGFEISIDRREQAPWSFAGLEHSGHALAVRRTWATLKTGDYSIVGLEDRVVVERKSLSDLYRSVGADRERFRREHERMALLDFAAVVVEAPWSRILEGYEHSRMAGESVRGTAIAWARRYGVHWVACEGRRAAEEMTFWILWHAANGGKEECDG